MSIPEISQIVRILLLALLALGLALFVFRWLRRKVESAAKNEIKKNDDTLVGMRAIAVTELRPNAIGQIRSALSSEKEDEIALGGTDKSSFEVYPAISTQIISKGRSVRVIGGNNELYRVRAAVDTYASDKK